MSTASFPKKILVISTMLLGDCLLATGVVRSLRSAYPNSTIDILVSRDGRLVYDGNPDVDNVIHLKKKPCVLDLLQFIRKNWRKYDLAINERVSDRTSLYTWVCGKKRVGLVNKKHSGASFQKSVYHSWSYDPEEQSHRMIRNLELVKLVGIPAIAKVVAPVTTDDDFLDTLPSKFVVVHAPASGQFKQWPKAHWQTLVSSLLERGYFIVLTGGPSARDRNIVDEITQSLTSTGNWINLTGKLSLAQTGLLIRKSSGFIGPDTGPAHLASASSIPQVVIFGPTPPNMWAPWPYEHSAEGDVFLKHKPFQQVENVCILQAKLDCVPCYAKQCKITQSLDAACLNEITPNQVMLAVEKNMPLV